MGEAATSEIPDVLVVGGGSAALCAAIAARRGGASVRMVEQAPVSLRGGCGCQIDPSWTARSSSRPSAPSGFALPSIRLRNCGASDGSTGSIGQS